MKIINGERASGKTDGLIFAAYATGARIIAQTEARARVIAERAKERGIDILPPMGYRDFLDGPAKMPVTQPEPILIDEAETIIKEALELWFRKEVIAVTISEPQIKTLFPETLEHMKDVLGPGKKP